MHPCHLCRRHVQSDSTSCPFCAAVLRHDTAPIAGIASILLGLALMGCGDDGSTDTGADSGTSATSPSTTTTSPSTTDSMTDATTGTFTTNDDMSATVAAYGDPSFDSSASLTENPESSSGTAESSSTDATGSESSSGGTGSTGTDTGSSSNASDVSDSADYGGAAPNVDR